VIPAPSGNRTCYSGNDAPHPNSQLLPPYTLLPTGSPHYPHSSPDGGGKPVTDFPSKRPNSEAKGNRAFWQQESEER